MTELERWLERFRQGAARAYTWDVTHVQTPLGPRRLLRTAFNADIGRPTPVCPLALQAWRDGFPSMLGLDMFRIMDAADDEPWADPVLRQQLLTLCGVEDLPPHEEATRETSVLD